MNKVLFTLVPLMLMGYLIGITLIPRSNLQMPEAGNKVNYTRISEKEKISMPPGHIKGPLNCKSCHACEYPTKEDPCLLTCPREDMMSTIRFPEAGPESVVIDQISETYEGVAFSHKLHSEMSKISMGCTGCHHYNTTGTVLKCSKCHEDSRKREKVSVPDLKAAFHRQCMTCHQQWSHDIGCDKQCHVIKSSDSRQILAQSIKYISGRTHPILPKPEKMIWETNYTGGKIVTFFHDEHVKLFKLQCSDCHSGENCTKCHDSKTTKDFSGKTQFSKSMEDHHKPCDNCHYRDACQKCHQGNEMARFNHGKTSGWNLKWYHSRLACARCHGTQMPYKRLDNNCTSCHRNFTPGSFEHKTAGMILSENHKELECNICHQKGNFASAPVCTDCHDDRSFPSQLPGKRIKR